MGNNNQARTLFKDNNNPFRNQPLLTLLARGDNSYGNITYLNNKTIRFVDVFIGNFQCFAIDNNGTLYSWGLNDYYQLANEKRVDYTYGTNDKKTFSVLYGNPTLYDKIISLGSAMTHADITFPLLPITIKEITCGDGFTLFLDKYGAVYSVGRNDKGQLGYELKEGEYELVSGIKCKQTLTKIPFFVDNDIKVSHIVSGSDFSFAKDNSQNVYYSWGNNSHSQLACVTNLKYVFNPLKASLLKDLHVIQIECGWMHGSVLCEDGALYMWGNPFYDYNNKEKDIMQLKQIEYDIHQETVISFANGFHHFALIVSDNNTKRLKLKTFGANDFGQLGYETVNSVYTYELREVKFPEHNNDIVEVYCGAFHTICKLSNGVLYGFGQNDNGQLSDYTSEYISHPVKWNYNYDEIDDDEEYKHNNSIPKDIMSEDYKSLRNENFVNRKVLIDIKCGNGSTLLIFKNKKDVYNDNSVNESHIVNERKRNSYIDVSMSSYQK